MLGISRIESLTNASIDASVWIEKPYKDEIDNQIHIVLSKASHNCDDTVDVRTTKVLR